MEGMEQATPEQTSPLDGIIARVQEYQKNPQAVTPETLGELLNELMGLKEYIDGEDMMEEPQSQNMDSFSGQVEAFGRDRGMGS